MSEMISALQMWTARRWWVALGSGVIVAVIVALPTAVIPNPIFGRAIEVTWWSYPTVIITGILGGLLIATYIKEPSEPGLETDDEVDTAMKLGGVGGFIAFFAVGCPVCNKLVLIALGSSGAISWFAPIQPILAFASIALMAWALRMRLRGSVACAVPTAMR
jgi:hypothetical protein